MTFHEASATPALWGRYVQTRGKRFSTAGPRALCSTPQRHPHPKATGQARTGCARSRTRAPRAGARVLQPGLNTQLSRSPVGSVAKLLSTLFQNRARLTYRGLGIYNPLQMKKLDTSSTVSKPNKLLPLPCIILGQIVVGTLRDIRMAAPHGHWGCGTWQNRDWDQASETTKSW